MYHKQQSHNVWFLRYWAQQSKFFVILDHFLPFYPPKNPRNQNFEKMKKKPRRYIIILHKCTINDNHDWWCIVLEIWSVTDRIFCYFGLFFALLPHWQPKKLKFWKTEKTSWRYHHFMQVYHLHYKVYLYMHSIKMADIYEWDK